jgi:two-component system, response regulator FlrC
MRAEVAHSGQFPALMIGQTLADVERGLILETLRHVLGNRTHAANILGISIRTLRNKINEYAGAGVEIPPPRNWSVGSHQEN